MEKCCNKGRDSLLFSVNQVGETGQGLKTRGATAYSWYFLCPVWKNKGIRRIRGTDLLRRGEEVRGTLSDRVSGRDSGPRAAPQRGGPSPASSLRPSSAGGPWGGGAPRPALTCFSPVAPAAPGSAAGQPAALSNKRLPPHPFALGHSKS